MTVEEEKALRLLPTVELQAKLTALDFEGAGYLKTKDQILAVMKSLEKNTTKSDVALEANTPMINDNVKEDEKNHSGKEKLMKEYLEKQPKAGYAIPLDIGERIGAYLTVTMNGYRLSIMKGRVVQLPQPVIDLLSESFAQTQAAGADLLLDRSEEIASRL